MSFEIKFTPEAEETYDALVSQLRQRWGDRFVIKFEIKVLKCLDTITRTPFISHRRRKYRDKEMSSS